MPRECLILQDYFPRQESSDNGCSFFPIVSNCFLKIFSLLTCSVITILIYSSVAPQFSCFPSNIHFHIDDWILYHFSTPVSLFIRRFYCLLLLFLVSETHYSVFLNEFLCETFSSLFLFVAN